MLRVLLGAGAHLSVHAAVGRVSERLWQRKVLVAPYPMSVLERDRSAPPRPLQPLPRCGIGKLNVLRQERD